MRLNTQMRIISGTAKGSPIMCVPGDAVRPTPERMRGAVFNILGPEVVDANVLDLFAGTSHDTLHYIKSYPIHAASGDLGPKRREGDRQVPEGLYRIDSLNPNSRFHLSMRVDYPNADDRRIAQLQNRTDLGGDIFIHGGAASIGCVAVGDPAIEELFTLAADIGIENSEVILAPLDLRTRPLPDNLNKAPWPQRYNDIQSRLTQLPTPAPADP